MLLRFEIVFSLMLINSRYLAFLKAILVLILLISKTELQKFGHKKFQILKLLPF